MCGSGSCGKGVCRWKVPLLPLLTINPSLTLLDEITNYYYSIHDSKEVTITLPFSNTSIGGNVFWKYSKCILEINANNSEDMDTLTFGSPVLLRHLTFSEARKVSRD